MDESNSRRSNLEEVIDAVDIEWILCFVAEDQSIKLTELMNNLQAEKSETGDGKKIDSGYSYWGIGPTCAWTKACADPRYAVMFKSTKHFMEGWEKVLPALGGQRYHYVSLGVGTGKKDSGILRELHKRDPDMSYFPVDMSPEMLRVGTRRANDDRQVTRHNVWPIQIDFALKSNVAHLRDILDKRVGGEPILFSLLGNTLANFEDDTELLKTLSSLIGPDDRLLLEVARTDHLHDQARLAAEVEYANNPNFREFATSALLQNTDLHIGDLRDVHCMSSVEPDRAIVIKTLHRSRKDTTITLPDRSPVEYRAGDTIRLYLSRKYIRKGIGGLLGECGFPVLDEHTLIFGHNNNPFRFGINLMLLGAPARSVACASAPSIFISYSHEDTEFARRLYEYLKVAGVNCWLDTLDMRMGDPIRSVLFKRIREYDKFLVILSESALRSKWVEEEVSIAFNMEFETGDRRRVLPARLDDAVMKAQGEIATRIRERSIADFSQLETEADYRRAFDKLLRDLKAGA